MAGEEALIAQLLGTGTGRNTFDIFSEIREQQALDVARRDPFLQASTPLTSFKFQRGTEGSPEEFIGASLLAGHGS